MRTGGWAHTRTLINGLTDDDLIILSAHTGEPWARMAKIGVDGLRQPSQRTVRAIRMALARRGRDMYDALAWVWSRVYRHYLDGHDGGGESKYFAHLAALLGANAGKVVLNCVAESGYPEAETFSARLSEFEGFLLETATADNRTPSEDKPIDTSLEWVRAARDEGTRLGTELREAAATVESGIPTPPGLGKRIDAWSARVCEFLASFNDADLTNLQQAEDWLVEREDVHAEKAARAREVYNNVTLLRENGMAALIPHLLDEAGFESEGALRAAFDDDGVAMATPDEVQQPKPDPHDKEMRDAPYPGADRLMDNVGHWDGPLDGEPKQPFTESDLSETRDEGGSEEFSSAERDTAVVEEPQDVGSQEATEEPAVAGGESQDVNAPSVAQEPRSRTNRAADEAAARGDVAEAVQEQPSDPVASAPTTQPPPADEDPVESPAILASPWEHGDAVRIADLIDQGRFAVAVHVATAWAESATRVNLLKLLCASWCCSAESLELTACELVPDESEVTALSADESRVLLAASLQAGRRLGYAPLSLPSLLERVAQSSPDASATMPLLKRVADAVTRHEPISPVADSEAGLEAWQEAEQLLTRLRQDTPLRKIKYQRASRVLQFLVRDDQLVGMALAAAQERAQIGPSGVVHDDWDLIVQAATSLTRTPSRLIDAADAAVSTPIQRREHIIAGARKQLENVLDELGSALQRLLGLRRSAATGAGDRGRAGIEISRLVAKTSTDALPPTVGGAALRQFIASLGQSIDDPTTSLDDVLDEELLPIFSIARNDQGRPTRGLTVDEISELLAPTPPEEVVQGYLRSGNFDAAQSFAVSQHLDGEKFADDLERARAEREAELRQFVDGAELVASRLRALDRPEEAHELVDAVDKLRRPTNPDRYDLASGLLKSVTDHAVQALAVEREGLLQRASQVQDPSTRERISGLLARGDEVLAIEFLTRVEAGESLPASEPPTGDDFTRFFPEVVRVAEEASARGEDPVAAVREHATGPACDPQAEQAAGMEAWAVLRRFKRDPAKFDEAFRAVLAMLGLIRDSGQWWTAIAGARLGPSATYQIRAHPADRSYVPHFGTKANGKYDVTLVWERMPPRKLLDQVSVKRATRPNIIFYFGVLNTQQRRELRRQTLPDHGHGFSPIVIDDAVIGWLTTRPELGWRITQRVTLPFTTLNPYTPFAAGEVPDEVFVGRESERRDIEDPTGPMFVYGGRQLGKSALLRRVERLFTDELPLDGQERNGNVALYIDLKARGIGESTGPMELWPELAQRLKDIKVLPEKTGRRLGVDEVASELAKWLDRDNANRLLLLLDEADNFLTADSRSHPKTHTGEFAVLNQLKSIMIGSNRRFKAVFAGLHQVQRFHDRSNAPVVQGGSDAPILIGPLNQTAAYGLVRDPMLALGYEFADPDLIWKLLMYTNYQASLVQIMCEALVKHLWRKPIPVSGGRIGVTAEDLEIVYSKPAVRGRLAERFRLTINLDSRYQVIALSIAHRSLASEPGATFTIDAIREDCATYWPDGFSSESTSDPDFRRYLDEMVGLGVLYTKGGNYGLRSPNIGRMLGTAAELEAELLRAESTLEMPMEYDPALNRRILDEPATPGARRSPLSDGELASLLALRHGEEAAVSVVYGSRALGIERVREVLQRAAESAGLACRMVETVDDADAIAVAQTPRQRTHVIIDLIGQIDVPAPALVAVAQRLRLRNRLTATIVIAARHHALLTELRDRGVPVRPLHRLTPDELRAWYDSHFEGRDERAALHRVTRGWLGLVERAMALSDGMSRNDALVRIRSEMSDVGRASTLIADSGVDSGVVREWASYLARPSDDGLVEAEPASLTDLRAALGDTATNDVQLLRDLDMVTETADGWVLDRVIAASADLLNDSDG